MADAALNELYTKHVINSETKVWQRGMDSWISLKNTDIYKLFGRKSYSRLKMLSSATKLFRGQLAAFAILIFGTIILDLRRIRYFETLMSDNETTAEFLKCVGIEYQKISRLTTAILFVLFIFLAKAAYGWIFTIVSTVAD